MSDKAERAILSLSCEICGSTSSSLSNNGKCNDVTRCDENRKTRFPSQTVAKAYDTSTKEHFRAILEEVFAQISGKGEERHGHGAALKNQPWHSIAEQVNNGRAFLEGQAIKKITEASHFEEPPRYRKEMLGAAVYTVFAIMRREEEDSKRKA